MNKSLLRECLARVALVTRDWADDPALSASLRHMSLYVHQLASEVSRRKELCSTSVKNVEARFCLMCRRVSAGSGACRQQSLEHCEVLKNATSSVVRQRIINLGLLDAPPKAHAEHAEISRSQ